MKTHHPFVRALLLSVLMGMLVASAALAKTGGLGFIRLSAGNETSTPCPSPSPSPSESPSDVQEGSDEQESDDEGTSDEQESDDEGTSDEQESDECQDSDKKPKPRPSPSADRVKACMEAAGMTEEGDGGSEDEGKATGLDNAIERVLANCIKNPQAPGLLNALQHLADNREAHAAHEAEKADRRAAHDAAKAERQAAKAAKGHGH